MHGHGSDDSIDAGSTATAGPDEVWVLGDGRNHSNDSRWWFDGKGGGVPTRDVLGRVFDVWLSTLSNGITRTERVGHSPSGTPTLPTSLRALQPALDRCLASNPPMEPVR
jgi:signal peptidase I